MGLSKLDLWYRRLILTKFYTRGWGKPEDIKEILKMHKVISRREECFKFISPDYPVTIDKTTKLKSCTLLHGHFITPMVEILPRLVPPAVQVSRFEVVLPKDRMLDSGSSECIKPACIQMAGTGDHGFQRRRELIAKPLLQSGITSVLLENPFYGSRKPKEQWRSGLLHVADLFIMGGCLILEAQVLLHWLRRMGYGPLGLTGISMGGHMASLAATNWPEPVALVPCMSWTSASVVWTEGVLSKSVPWRILEAQYARDPKYEVEISKLLRQVDSYEFGKDFVTRDNHAALLDTAVDEAPSSDLTKQVKKFDEQRRQRETIKFMKGVMDEITHLGNYSRPVDTSSVTFVSAKEDAYFPQSSLEHMSNIWPGCEIREINAGHVAGCLIHHSVFTKAIVDTFSRLIRKRHFSSDVDHLLGENKNELIKSSDVESSLLKQSSSVPVTKVLKSFLIKS